MPATVGRRRLAATVAMLLLLAPLAVAAPQSRRPRETVARPFCDGDTVTAIDIRAHPPTSSDAASDARAATARALDIRHVIARPGLIAAYLRLAVGDVCTERDRQESERLLRAQPFIASASVQAQRESPGHVRITVDVTDEFSPIAGLSIRRGTVASLLLGTQDLQGRGLALEAHAERGFAYRNGVGGQAVQYGVLGWPVFVALDAQRLTVAGQILRLEVAEPYLTDLQSRAFHAGASLSSGYADLVRPDGDNVSLFVRHTAYDIGWVTRLRHLSGHGAVALVGAALLGEDVRTSPDLVFVSDTGLVAGPANPFAFSSFATTRVAAIGGLRALRFVTVRGFDALTAEQDMGVGMQFDLLAGSSAFTPAHRKDVFFASDFYAGVGGPGSFVVLRAIAEARAVNKTHSWDGVVASGRLAWYGNASGESAHLASVEMAVLQHLVFPAQLTFADANGGLPGFGGSSSAGGQRLVARVEERHLIHTFGAHADAAVGVFATAGKLWAGDVPYGQTSALRTAVGVSLLGAYPGGGKRTYRIDLAIPLNPEHGGARFELRLSAIDRTRLLWQEAGDVVRARTDAVPVSLMKW